VSFDKVSLHSSLSIPLRSAIGSSSLSSAVLLVADFFHPLNGLPVKLLLNGDMRHTTGCSSAMLVFHARRYPYDITRLGLLLFTTLLLHPACAGRHDQGLAESIGMPCRAGTMRERDGSFAWNRGSTRTDPVKLSTGPCREGCDPLRVMMIVCGSGPDAVGGAAAPAWFAWADAEASRASDMTVAASSFMFVLSIQ
jgi:hypothetical protein